MKNTEQNPKTRFTVIGAGHGGKAMAAHLALMGFPTTLYNRTQANIEFIQKRGGIELESYEGGPNGFGELVLATSDMKEALRDAEVIMVVVPSNAHQGIAQNAAPHLSDGQIVLLNPGRTLGAIEFDKTIRENGCHADVTIAEAETFLYASRSDGPSQAHIFRIKDSLPLAALPATRTQLVLDAVSPAFPQFISGENVLHTSLNNMGSIFHPALTILNAGRIESTGGDYQYYIEGATPSVSRVLEAMDRERVTVASALGIRAQTAIEWLKRAYSATGENLYEAIQNQTGYYGITAPKTLNHRYIFEDVPFSLVPIAALGQQYGVSVRCMDSIIRLACVIHRTDYWRRGRTLQKLGIQGLSVNELTHYVMEGIRPD
ncbi:MAG: NAD/NADP octopine/nopaline dehydrogenase family protein [Chloroflexi bacterium]|nr:NAD/NADP octopine/nopaline dehydrogenase family protein [Chloroflexota bacterium]